MLSSVSGNAAGKKIHTKVQLPTLHPNAPVLTVLNQHSANELLEHSQQDRFQLGAELGVQPQSNGRELPFQLLHKRLQRLIRRFRVRTAVEYIILFPIMGASIGDARFAPFWITVAVDLLIAIATFLWIRKKSLKSKESSAHEKTCR